MAVSNNKQPKKRFEFSKIGGIIESISEKTSIMIETENTKKEFIGTGIYVLNALLSKSILNGGIQNNRITVFAGVSGVGKSFLAYNICREAQAKGYCVIYIDTEFSVELTDFTNYGIDINPDRLKLVRSNKVEDIKVFLTQMLSQLKDAKLEGYDIDKFVIVLDSAGQLASNKEVNDAKEGKDKVDMSRAKAMKQLFRIINSDLGFLNIPLITTNHTYFTQDIYPQEVMSGGTGLQYSATTIVFLSKAKLKDGSEDELDLGQTGIVVTAKSVKNRLAKPKRIKFEISFATGCNPYVGLDYWCTPENFETVGIAQGKMDVNKKTGEMTFMPGGNRWYVNHLNKSVTSSQLFTPSVFTDKVLNALEPIIFDYFKYKSMDEMNDVEKDFMEVQDQFENVDIDDVDGADLFA